MKQVFTFIAAAFLLVVVGCQPKTGNNNDTTESSVTQPEQSVMTPIALKDCNLAFTSTSDMVFLANADSNAVAPFDVEKDTVFNYVFVTDLNRFYYTVKTNNTLKLRYIDFNDETVVPHDVIDWGKTPQDCFSETDGLPAKLIYKNNSLYIACDFDWDSYNFSRAMVYDLTTNTLRKSKLTNNSNEYMDLITSNNDEGSDSFSMQNQQYYYKMNGKKVCLSDKIDFNSLVSDPDYAEPREFFYPAISPDGKRVCYGVMVEMGDLGHGPYCIANLDGSGQKALKGTDLSNSYKPKWTESGSLVFISDTLLNVIRPAQSEPEVLYDRTKMFVIK